MLANVLIAARSQEARTVIRVLDNQPLLDPRMLDACARYALDSGMDYVRVARLPGGVSAEAMLVRTLERSASLTQDAGDRANVTSFALSHPEMFERAFLPPPQRLARPDLNLALNSEADYALLGRLFREVPACMNGLIRLEDAIAWTDTHGDQAREIGPRLAA
jgi:spore coat polysaccharide biosynthesis protein SpsF (cytidylyltransferase family)